MSARACAAGLLGAGARLAAVSLAVGAVCAIVAPGEGAPRAHPLALTPVDVPRGRAPSAVAERAVSLTVRGRPVRAVLVAPRDAPARTGLVLVHGSGFGSVARNLPRARALAACGVAVLVPEKILDGYDWAHRDYRRLGEDGLEGAAWLGRRLGLVPGRTGLFGVSEGGWAVLAAAAAHPELRGPLLIESGPVVTPLEQVAHSAAQPWTDAVPRLRGAIASCLAMGRPIIDYLDWDVRPLLPSVRSRVIAVFGERDATVPVGQAAARLREGLPTEPSILVVPGGHATRVGAWAPLAVDRLGDPDLIPAEGEQLAVGVDPATLGRLERSAPEAPGSSWLLDPRWHLAIAAAALVIGRGVRAALARTRTKGTTE